MKADPIQLRELITPRSSNVLDNGHLIKSEDKERRLWYFAQYTFGWSNWLQSRGIPFSEDPTDLFFEAATKVGFSRDEAGTILDGDTIAWAHLFSLRPELAEYCPPETKQSVAEYINEYRQHVPKQHSDSKAFKNRKSSPAEGDPAKQMSAEESDTTFAALGREIANSLGEEKDGHRQVEGKANYRIVINLASNTMRIYAKDRGDDPILIDANGQIDHAASRVVPEDVRRFQQIANRIREHQHSQNKEVKEMQA
ncbi:hypothetical protein [cf. Phormidesmis sp. LEGE 11477]|uniref:hypothetical protein n=1 Tax=cf. Phormidesmis sp. LEGE 11477 TaxID=1828680 RepID=UPI00188032DC|nr:hypothetical protein [cf. Phormidesmis sp. LEGE 11477]MBE9064119.1 hypothetical protein [cf. Phormidesmis sp. LEGE 11477]